MLLASPERPAQLTGRGGTLESRTNQNAYVSGREHLPGYMRARDAAIGHLPPVGSTLMIVSGFARKEFVVEVEAIAALPAAVALPVSSPGTGAAPTAASIASAVSGRRRLHARSADGRMTPPGPVATGRRALHGKRVASASVEACVRELRASGLKVLAAADGDNERREVLRRSRDFCWYSPVLKSRLHGRSADAVVARGAR